MNNQNILNKAVGVIETSNDQHREVSGRYVTLAAKRLNHIGLVKYHSTFLTQIWQRKFGLRFPKLYNNYTKFNG